VTVPRPLPRPPDPEPGTVIGSRYQLIEVAGKGGMADVWRGQVVGDHGFTRVVAIKQMHTALAEKPAYVKMFIEEARLGSMLDSPNLAEIRDFVSEDGNYYLVMEWVDGIDLGTWIHWHRDRSHDTKWELVAAIGIGILRGLAAAHERVGPDGKPMPVVHRDVSPHNILLTTKGLVKLIDFGLAMAPDRASESTDPGVVKGKMAYLSPEIVNGGKPIPPSDLFACGSVMWEALVGRKLFEGATDFETYKKVRDCVVQPLRPARPDVPAPLAALIHRALSPGPEQRFPSAREFARQLATVLKKSTMRKDFHHVLARSVSEVRGDPGFGRRVGDPSSTTPIADVRDFTPSHDDRKGLWHRLPFIGRRR
jgi:eukaryotic-like serine/threonine-protein kinase